MILNEIIENLHTTSLGEKRIQKNLGLSSVNVIKFLKEKIKNPKCIIYQVGKNYYCDVDLIRITVNSSNYCIITAHPIKICFYVPKIEDFWYQEKIQSDPSTMSYNAGYEVTYLGYHYDTGCVDFPKEKWKEVIKKRKEDSYFAYLQDSQFHSFLGYVYYQYNAEKKYYDCGILIENSYRGRGYSFPALKQLCDVARKNGISELYDSFESDREHTLSLFQKVGFQIVEKQKWKKFGKEVEGVLVEIKLS